MAAQRPGANALANPQAGPVKLWRNQKEQEVYDNKADLYAIIKTTEKLERAYVRDFVTPQEYELACSRLINQFKTLTRSLSTVVPDVEQFMVEYNLQCPLAAQRLIHSGLPATIEHKSQQQQSSDTSVAHVAATVAAFISVMDAIQMDMVAVDQICPLLLDIITGLDKISSLPPAFEPREQVKKWYNLLHLKPATYKLPEDESRQMSYEMTRAYTAFMEGIKAR